MHRKCTDAARIARLYPAGRVRDHEVEPQLDIGNLEAFYDERYEGEYMSVHGDLEVWRVRETLRSVSLPPAPSVVDYGCGRGAWVPVLRAAFGEARVVGVEISPKAVDEARREHPYADFLTFDGSRAPLPDASADLVFSYHVLEHVLDLSETVADMARVVRPGGYVCAICPCANRASIEELTTRLVENGVERSSTGEARFFYEDPGHLRRLTSEQLAARFAEHGCRLVDEFYERHLAAVNYICSLPWFVRRLFDPSRARTRSAAIKLTLLRASFMSVAVLLRAHRDGARELARVMGADSGPRGRLLILGVRMTQPLALLAAAALETALPKWEWRRTAHQRRGGAAQFLVFRKS
jgi:SAM-dependent methyltransferase